MAEFHRYALNHIICSPGFIVVVYELLQPETSVLGVAVVYSSGGA